MSIDLGQLNLWDSAASPRPWFDDGDGDVFKRDAVEGYVELIEYGDFYSEADGALTAAARNALPALIEAVEAVHEERAARRESALAWNTSKSEHPNGPIRKQAYAADARWKLASARLEQALKPFVQAKSGGH